MGLKEWERSKITLLVTYQSSPPFYSNADKEYYFFYVQDKRSLFISVAVSWQGMEVHFPSPSEAPSIFLDVLHNCHSFSFKRSIYGIEFFLWV